MIRRVLVANRGEIAIRIFSTLREMNIESVAVFTEADETSIHRRFADHTRLISSYLDADAILEAAKETGADAIHPGYGFLSERTSLSSACETAGITFVGPRTETIRLMGDKLESKAILQKAGVPVVPAWDANPPESEFPVLVKAVGGGGGKGMRLVESRSALPEALSAASREAAKAFGDERVFTEKYIHRPRHIEFQILGDLHGNIVHLFERECSIQRRHQKIIEETPSPAMTPELRTAMGEAALAAARAVNYENAGTVEFIVEPDGRFYFLEMNTRLQVEHPITEMTTGIDIVREQIQIADGRPISFRQSELTQRGHALECRIYAEIAEEHFRPSTGSITLFRPPQGPGIRLDSGVEEGSVVGIHFDPMLAKLVAGAATRQEAISRMKRALDEFVILGVNHNVDFLRRVISARDFEAGELDTHFLDRHPEVFRDDSSDLPLEVLLAASLGASSPTSNFTGTVPTFSDVWTSGRWRNT
jgi:acetyl/propionyl-CoA carboxylase alpha subunit